MQRRSFLGGILASAATAIMGGTRIGESVVDPERALWVPGQKTIFIPKPVFVEPTIEVPKMRLYLSHYTVFSEGHPPAFREVERGLRGITYELDMQAYAEILKRQSLLTS